MSDLAAGCVCGRCDPACKFRLLASCCGACMVDSPHFDPNGETPTECWARVAEATAAKA